MFDGISSQSSLGIHVVLATIPQRQEREFLRSVDQHYYQRYREELLRFTNDGSNKSDSFYHHLDQQKKTPLLYNPIKYHLFGNYDIACISLIDNFKFSQRLFEPEFSGVNNPDSTILSPYSFQGFSGIVHQDEQKLKDFFYKELTWSEPAQRYFLGICNLKLNNAFLIGNGRRFLQAVRKKVDEIIGEYNSSVESEKVVDWLFFQPFSWFEQSVILLTDRPESIVEINRRLRRLSVEQLDGVEPIVKNSLYSELFPDIPTDDLAKANVFGDTHTYLGIHAGLIESDEESPNFKRFMNTARSIEFKTEIELQVKPGHMHLLIEFLRHKVKTDQSLNLDLDKSYWLSGKSDYLLRETADDIETNVRLLRLSMDPASGLYDHIRKIRTRMLFEVEHASVDERERKSLRLYEKLQTLGKTMRVIQELDKNLKALKVSRQIRNKIHKIFTNYNNGIQDPILFTYFLDFKVFIDDLEELIRKEYRSWFGSDASHKRGESIEDLVISEKDWLMVGVLENKLMKKIEIFQEGYNIRMLNCYQYEDLADFDLDFNSSIQQLLSAYNYLIMEIGNSFYKKEYKYGPVVQLNLKDTVSTYNSINYNVQHLTSPEIIFATVTKEILNCDQYDTESIRQIHQQFHSLRDELEKYSSHLSMMMAEGLIDLNYFLIDTTRFVLNYDLDFKLFYFWIWNYNLQNTMLYDKSGLINERHFRKELFRVLSVARFFEIPLTEVTCPLPEMQTFWDRHFTVIKRYVEKFLEFLNKHELSKKLSDCILQRFSDFYSLYGNLPPGPTKISTETVDKLRVLAVLKTNYSGQLSQDSYYARDVQYQKFRKEAGEMKEVEDMRHWYFYMLDYLKFFYEANDN